jgi:parallel beta-helix repeat protein
MRGRLVSGFAMAVAVFGVAAMPASAAQVSCGDTISQDTKVGNDLTDCSGDGLVVTTSDVTLDLNGHTIDGDDAGGEDGIVIQDGADDVIVKSSRSGAKIRQFEDGVLTGNSTGIRLESFTTTDNTDDGMWIDGSANILIRKVKAIGNDGLGFDFDLGSGAVIQNTVARDNNGPNYFLDGPDGLLEDSTSGATDNANPGLRITVNADRTLVRDFVSKDSSGIGVRVEGSDTTLLRVQSIGNDGPGFSIEAGPTKLIDSQALRGDQEGIFVDGAAQGTLLKGNRADRNTDDGIVVNDDSAALRKNTANDNGGFGIFAVAGVTDLGGNKASGNGTGQCQNVSCS